MCQLAKQGGQPFRQHNSAEAGREGIVIEIYVERVIGALSFLGPESLRNMPTHVAAKIEALVKRLDFFNLPPGDLESNSYSDSYCMLIRTGNSLHEVWWNEGTESSIRADLFEIVMLLEAAGMQWQCHGPGPPPISRGFNDEQPVE